MITCYVFIYYLFLKHFNFLIYKFNNEYIKYSFSKKYYQFY